LMSRAGGMSPLALLRRLKGIHRGLEKSMAAAAMAEGGDPEGARELLGKKANKGKK
jgi:hypothetical protein